MADGVRTLVRWQGNARLVTFQDTRLAASVERFTTDEFQRSVLVNLDAPPGTYEVASKSVPGGCWEIRLDPVTGQHVGFHSCPYRAERPRESYPCVHIAGAWLKWKQDHDNNVPFLRRLHELEEQGMSEDQSTALALRHSGAELTPYYVPTREELSNTLSLAKVLMETRGAAIPKGLATVQDVAAVIMAGHEMGMDPMTAFRRFYVIDGRTQMDAQGLAAKIQEGGGDLIYHTISDEIADVELRRAGREPLRIQYTMKQAEKSGSTTMTYYDKNKGERVTKRKPAWDNYPADLLVWKAVTRLAKFGAADLINAVSRSMVRIEDFDDAVRQLGPEDVHDAVWNEAQSPALTTSGQPIDHNTGEIYEQEEPPSNESGAESPSASASTPSGTTISEPNSAPTEREKETTGPVAGAAVGDTSPSPKASTENPSPSEPSRGLNYATAFADKAANHKVLSAFQRAIKGMGTLPADAQAMTLDEIVTAVGGSWPE